MKKDAVKIAIDALYFVVGAAVYSAAVNIFLLNIQLKKMDWLKKFEKIFKSAWMWNSPKLICLK